MDLEAVLGTPRVPTREVEPPLELQQITPRPMTPKGERRQSRASAVRLQTKISQTTTLVNSTQAGGNSSPSTKSDSSDNSFQSARSEPDSEPFPEFDPEYHPSNDSADFSLDALHSSVRDSHASNSTGMTVGMTLEVGEAREVRMTVHSPTVHRSWWGSNVYVSIVLVLNLT
jgi:hypothetical protein